MKAVCLLPSLSRAALVKKSFEYYKKANITIPVWVLVDKTDPQKEEYLKLEYPPGCVLILTEAITLGDKCRELWDQYVNHDAVMLINDDHLWITPEADEKILAQINGHNVIGTNDGPSIDKPWNAPHRICGAICFSGKVLRALGWMFPPGLQHLYSDDAWGYICGKAMNCNILMDVCVHHDHAYKDPTKKDDTYFKINGTGDFSIQAPTGGLWDNDRKALETWLKTTAEADAQRVLDLQPKTGFMVGTPTHDGNASIDYGYGIADVNTFCLQNNIYLEMAKVQGNSLIPHARNTIVDTFLKSRCQRLLFVDSDQGFNKFAFIHLVQSNKRIVAGVTPHKRYPLNLNFEPLEQDNKYFKELCNKSEAEFFKFIKERGDQRGEVEVNRSGTGFMMIDRSVFEIMRDHFRYEEKRIEDFKKRIETLLPDLAIEYDDIIKGYLNHKFNYSPYDDKLHVKHDEYFWMGADDGRFRGEDWYFTSLAKKLSIPIYINSHALVTHQGTHLWGINPGARLQ